MRTRTETTGTPQGAFTRGTGDRMYQQLQQIILDETGVSCTVLVTPHYVSIRAKDYPDYVLARKAIKGRVSVPIVRDE